MEKYRIVPKEAAIEDYQNSLIWYAQQQDELGEQFESDVLDTFERIASFPFSHAMLLDSKQARKARLSKFKHSILFVIYEESKTIEIVGIFHDAQHPNHWQERL